MEEKQTPAYISKGGFHLLDKSIHVEKKIWDYLII